MAQIFPIDFDEKLTMAQDDYILFSDSEDGNKIKKAQYKNLKGEPGTPGTPGKDGEDGAAATITVGSTTTGTPGSSASVTNSGTSSAAVLDFTIPQGAKGEPGEDGQDGADGAAATITVGTTTTLPAGSSATVTNVGTSQDAILNFGIPKGDQGTGSGDVNGPASSVDGDVVVFDGTTGKAIKDGSVSLATLSAGASAGATAVQPGDIGTAAACNTGTSSGNVPILDSNGKLATSTLPGVALTDTFTVSTSSDLTSLSSADQGDIAIVTTENKTYVLSQAPYSTAANWKEILAPTGGVTSVNGNTGAVTVEEVPSGGTEGQVLTQTNNGPAWQNATGGSEIEYVTQVEYNALLPGAASDGKHYFIYSTSGGGGWQPGVNTMLYLPLDGDVVDYSSYNRTMTVYGATASVGTPVFDTLAGGKKVANFIAPDNANSNWYAFTETLTDIPTSGDMTLSLWMNHTGSTGDYEHIVAYRDNYGFYWMSMINNGGAFLYHGSAQEVTSFSPVTGTWYNIICVVDSGTCYIYKDGTQIYSDSFSYGSGTPHSLTIGAEKDYNNTSGRYEPFYGKLSEVIIENAAWSAQEVSDYYDQTKGDYGIS